MKQSKFILGFILAAAISSCSRGEIDFVDFSKLDGANHGSVVNIPQFPGYRTHFGGANSFFGL